MLITAGAGRTWPLCPELLGWEDAVSREKPPAPEITFRCRTNDKMNQQPVLCSINTFFLIYLFGLIKYFKSCLGFLKSEILLLHFLLLQKTFGTSSENRHASWGSLWGYLSPLNPQIHISSWIIS